MHKHKTLLFAFLFGSLIFFSSRILAVHLFPGENLSLPRKLYADFDLRAVLEQIRTYPSCPAMVPAIFIVGAAIFFPVTALIGGTVFVFDPFTAILYCLAGVTLGGLLGFMGGRLLGQNRLPRKLQEKLKRFDSVSRVRGVVSVAAVRHIPIAPFTVVNVMLGASGISFGSFIFGTLLGMAPGIIAIALAKHLVA